MAESCLFFYHYLGDGIDDLAAYCGGYAFNLRILFQNRVSPPPLGVFQLS